MWSARRLLAWVCLLAVLSFSGAAEARKKTYCVGGYRGKPPGIHAHACDSATIRRQHAREGWHFHNYFFYKGKCYTCFDEVDDSCETDFAAQNPQFKVLSSSQAQQRCKKQNNAGHVYEHIVAGRPNKRPPRDPASTRPPRDPGSSRPPPRETATADHPLAPDATLSGVQPLAGGDAATLEGRLSDEDGQPRALDGGAFHITTPDGETVEIEGTVDPDGTTVRAPATLPEADWIDLVFVPVVNNLDPGETISADDPDRYPLQPPGDYLTPEVSTSRPDGSPPTAGESLDLTGVLRDEDGQPRPLDGGTFHITTPDGETIEVEGTVDPDGTTVRGTATLPDADAVTVAFVPKTPPLKPGETINTTDGAGERIALRQLPRLKAPEVLDFGTVTAGTRTEEHCVTLDLTGSTSLRGQSLALSLEGLGECEARPQLVVGLDAAGTPDRFRSMEPEALIPEMVYDGMQLCLSVPFCSGETAPPEAVLRLVPGGHTDRAVAVPVRWEVEGRSWLACNSVWLLPLLGGLGVLWVVAGFVRPHRFPGASTITVAADPKSLRRASPIRLREVRGSRSGFYRDARLGVHFDGSVNARVRGAAAVLRATKAGVAILPRAAIEVYDRRKRQWRPPQTDEESGGGMIVPAPGEVFRCGDVCFQIDPG